jgi:hypothetical protein
MSPHIQLSCGTANSPPVWQCQGCTAQQIASTMLPRNKADAMRIARNIERFQREHAGCEAQYWSMMGGKR